MQHYLVLLRQRSRHTKASSQHGFTIVELLIVIVVIAILATLVITSYNGIQAQANNSKTAAAVQAYKKALLLYAQEKGSYPSSGSACLGEGYATNTCFRSSPTINNVAGFNNNLRPYMGGSLPLPSTKVFQNGSIDYWGASMFANGATTLDGEDQYWWIVYYMDGNTKCPVGPIVSTSGWPNLSSTPPASGKSTSYAGGGSPFADCFIPMPDPATL